MMKTLHALMFRSRPAVVTAALLAFSCAAEGIPRVHAADDYLTAIEAEGNELEFLGQAKKEQEILMRSAPAKPRAAPKPKVPLPKQASIQTAKAPSSAPPDSMTQAEFEKALRGKFTGSYALYAVLAPSEKESVFREYREADAEGTIRFLPAVNQIIHLSSKNKPR
jgi:hypothetical protein